MKIILKFVFHFAEFFLKFNKPYSKSLGSHLAVIFQLDLIRHKDFMIKSFLFIFSPIKIATVY